MAVRWRNSRPAPAPADDGRWGVARLVAEREADRRARERGAHPAGPAGAAQDAPADRPDPDPSSDGEQPAAGGPDIDGPTRRTLTAVRRRRPGPAAIPTPDEDADDSVPGPRRPVTPAPSSPVPPVPRRSPTGPVPRLPAPRRPRSGDEEPVGTVYRPPAVSARPPVDLDEGLLGFSRLTRGRVGARVFTIVFVLIYLVILVQTLSTIV
ncbi:hypothetical protein [Pseudonocardia sp. ICBG1142]|uniref:hypothetical protein n=1 Tax=Pseudonocardia sp. ICBG1142 TaxID=2846760 RepID=UPI001CF6DBEE|nr:hypothetical protein [Pseudonocardia sp. ICBG1142]